MHKEGKVFGLHCLDQLPLGWLWMEKACLQVESWCYVPLHGWFYFVPYASQLCHYHDMFLLETEWSLPPLSLWQPTFDASGFSQVSAPLSLPWAFLRFLCLFLPYLLLVGWWTPLLIPWGYLPSQCILILLLQLFWPRLYPTPSTLT